MPEHDSPTERPRDEHPRGAASWGRPVVLAVSMLVLGFVGGWILRGDDGPVTVVPPATTTADAASGATTTAGGDGDSGESTAPTSTTPTAPATTAPPAPPARDTIELAILNATGTAGLAAQNQATAEGLGYTGVEVGNAPTQTGPSIVYFRAGDEAAADRVAEDFQVSGVLSLPDTGPLAAAAPGGAQVVLVLGPG